MKWVGGMFSTRMDVWSLFHFNSRQDANLFINSTGLRRSKDNQSTLSLAYEWGSQQLVTYSRLLKKPPLTHSLPLCHATFMQSCHHRFRQACSQTVNVAFTSTASRVIRLTLTDKGPGLLQWSGPSGGWTSRSVNKAQAGAFRAASDYSVGCCSSVKSCVW